MRATTATRLKAQNGGGTIAVATAVATEASGTEMAVMVASARLEKVSGGSSSLEGGRSSVAWAQGGVIAADNMGLETAGASS